MYTKISKPGSSSYTKLAPRGNEFFDDTAVTFDSATFFNGVDMSAWTDVSKPIYTTGISRGMTMGLLIPLTASTNLRTGDPWVRINKPI